VPPSYPYRIDTKSKHQTPAGLWGGHGKPFKEEEEFFDHYKKDLKDTHIPCRMSPAGTCSRYREEGGGGGGVHSRIPDAPAGPSSVPSPAPPRPLISPRHGLGRPLFGSLHHLGQLGTLQSFQRMAPRGSFLDSEDNSGRKDEDKLMRSHSARPKVCPWKGVRSAGMWAAAYELAASMSMMHSPA